MRHGRRNIKLIKPFYPHAFSTTICFRFPTRKTQTNWLTDIRRTLKQPKSGQLEANEN